MNGKKISLAEVTWPFLILAIALDVILTLAYIFTEMPPEVYVSAVTAKFSFLGGILGGAYTMRRRVEQSEPR